MELIGGSASFQYVLIRLICCTVCLHERIYLSCFLVPSSDGLPRDASITHAHLMRLCRTDLLHYTPGATLPLSQHIAVAQQQQSHMMQNNQIMAGFNVGISSYAAPGLTPMQSLSRNFLDLKRIEQATAAFQMANNVTSSRDPSFLMAAALVNNNQSGLLNSMISPIPQQDKTESALSSTLQRFGNFNQVPKNYNTMKPSMNLCLPAILARPADKMKLSEHQHLLRFQIEAFAATEEDVSTHTRGRNKPIILGQVGIRCRHCAHIPVSRRQKGSTYFPASILGIYQAAQNMSTAHIQCGLCTEMPEQLKEQFKHSIAMKSSGNGAGRPYWAQSAKEMGLVDTEDGIRFILDIQKPGH
jgi:hypothetical protein